MSLESDQYLGAACVPMVPWEKMTLAEKVSVDRQFFPGKGRPSAKAADNLPCKHCPIQMDCMRDGIVHDEIGIWGGLSRKHRRELPAEVRFILLKEALRMGLFQKDLLLAKADTSDPYLKELLAWVEAIQQGIGSLQEYLTPPVAEVQTVWEFRFDFELTSEELSERQAG